MKLKNIFNLPNILTLIRLVLSPVMLPVLFVYILPLNVFWMNYLLAGLFGLFSITDLFDGFLARRYQQVSSLGRFLDPIADKFLVYSALIALLTINKIFFVWVLILIGREFFVLGLRQIALEHNFSIQVSWFAKFKTLFQTLYITVLVANPFHTLSRSELSRFISDLYRAPVWTSIETFLLVLAVSLSLFSAMRYYQAFLANYIDNSKN
jgi:CDP-diacylglycerol--glycerol-3-phosphate 3-phosphatidyltransferase